MLIGQRINVSDDSIYFLVYSFADINRVRRFVLQLSH